MTGPVSAADATVANVQGQSDPLGLTWQLRVGTVVSGDTPAEVTLAMDNDSPGVLITASSWLGALPTGLRVYVVGVPPAGQYVVGVLRAAQLEPRITVLGTSDTTYTPPAGLQMLFAEVIGGGGAGGGAAITIALQWSFGEGGGGGGYAAGWVDLADLSAGMSVTVGAGGTGVAGASGNSGAASTFLTLTGNGGTGGDFRGAGTTNYGPNTGGQGGTGSGGDLQHTGAHGGIGLGIVSTATGVRAGFGGASFRGNGGYPGVNAVGGAGSGYGGGGGGTAHSATQGAARAGGAGADGGIILWEYL